ncbi:lipopolysaccharide biosynthesis protein [Aurantiacibacter marinus]|uniref:Uncharacterized protein n=1 Tax=Aurantiacibacter marinus TaxID=874156 RepID=A0A0H0XWF4_9SPHN|nr:lipopolysaccharide biosynthesis protein [Aurantiacibacter marinus]KLI64635.1 hypothetical protein AAV99_03525 [Aurantiacibacter marinus]
MAAEPTTSISGKVLRGGAWLAAAQISVTLLSLGSTIVLARLLVPEDFGLTAIAITIMALLTAVSEMALHQALIRHPAPQREHFDTAFTLNMLRGAFMSAALVLTSGPVSLFFEDLRLQPILCVFAASLLVLSAANPRRAILQRKLVYWQEIAFSSGAKIAMVVVSVSAALYWQSYWAIVAGLVASHVASFVISYLAFPYLPRFRLTKVRELLSFSVWLTLGNLVDQLNWRFDILLIGRLLGATSTGFYSVGNNLATVPTRELMTPVRQALFPGFAKLIEKPGRLGAGYSRAQNAIMLVTLPVGVIASFMAEPGVLLLMGEKWQPIVFIIAWLAPIFALQSLGSLAPAIAMATGDTRRLFVRSMQMLIVRMPLIIAGAVFGGLSGLVYARCLSGIVGIGFNIYIVRELAGVSMLRQIRSAARPGAAAGMMALALLALQNVPIGLVGAEGHAVRIALTAVVGAATYLCSVFVLWLVAGRPDGGETEIMGHAHTALRKILPGNKTAIERTELE